MKDKEKCKKHGVIHKNGGYKSCYYPTSESWEAEFDCAFNWIEQEKERCKIMYGFTSDGLKSFIRTLLEREKKESFEQGKEEMRDSLVGYTEHSNLCILYFFEAGRPTESGGYEQKFKGKWYEVRPIDNTPQCNCGLHKILSTTK